MKLKTVFYRMLIKLRHDSKGVATGEIVLMAAGFIVAAYVLIPGFRAFANKLISGLNNWYDGSIEPKIFQTE